MATVFVSGGSGFVGRRLIERLTADGHTVHALARSEQAAQAVSERGALAIRGELSDAGVIAEGASGADWAVHAAANVSDWGDPSDFERDNVVGTANMLSACAGAGIRRFVHVGTEAAILVGQPLVNADESLPLRPDSPVLYSASKARAEALVLAANRDGFETVVIRPRWIWGPDDTVLLPRLVEQVRAGKFRWVGGGNQELSTTHVDNVVEGIMLGAARGVPGSAYFVTDGDPVVFREFVGALLTSQGVETPTRSIPRPVADLFARVGEFVWRRLALRGRPPITRFAVWYSSLPCTVNDAKAREQLGYRPLKTHAQGLEELRQPV